MKSKILPLVLKNAYEYNGSVNSKAVLGLVLRSHPDLKRDVPAVLKEIELLAKDLKGLSKAEIERKLTKLNPNLLKNKKEETKGPLKALPNAIKGKVIVRIAPSPSGALHIGHAYGASLNYEYARMYNGKFIVRIEDTNPENIYSKAYELIERDANWLAENKVDKVVVQSDRLGTYYDYAQKLVEQEDAYVCECDASEWRELKNNGKPCGCRSLTKKEQHSRYTKMFNEYAEGEAVLRLKTNIKHKNPAMRDFALMRVNEHVHPKTGKEQRVWPLMVFSVAIDDHELGITHVLNGKDHTDNARKEAIIIEKLGWSAPEYKHWGRINFEGMKISSSETKRNIEQNEFEGWDDIRLPFLPALRRRGYQPEAFRKFAVEIGLSLNDKTVSVNEFWKMVNAFNKEIVEPKANRYFVVLDSVEVKIEQAPPKKVSMDLHPDFPKRGVRELEFKGTCQIARKDFENLEEGKMHRLIDCCNFVKRGNKFEFVSEEYEEYKNAKNKGKILHWLPVKENITVDIMQVDGRVIQGICEKSLKNVKKGDIVQLERMHFAQVDEKTKDKLTLWYLHT